MRELCGTSWTSYLLQGVASQDESDKRLHEKWKTPAANFQPMVVQKTVRVTEPQLIPKGRVACGDHVYIDDYPYPVVIFHIGYDQYKDQVWVVRTHEDTNKCEIGMWIAVDRCVKLEIGDWLTATSKIIDASEGRHVRPQREKVRFGGFDLDGDVIVKHGLRELMVFYKDMDQLSLIWPNYETKERALASGSQSRPDPETGTFEEASSSASLTTVKQIAAKIEARISDQATLGPYHAGRGQDQCQRE